MSDEPVLTLDTLGRRCPVPVIELARHITSVDVGAVVEVLTDDDAATIDVPVWCRMKGHTYLGAAPLDAPGKGRSLTVRRTR
ncbi:MAG TPA: sulfurtransferase TusA family protein [Mycobacteriales bacterium]|nr:sulfurtransferase TusA family protein [Mycobacteriales bacterium]